MAKPISDIAPLREDLASIVPGSFLISTEFKRWLVQEKLNTEWDRLIKFAKNHNSLYVMGDDGSCDASDAMTFLLNDLFHEERIEELGEFIYKLVAYYNEEKERVLDTSNLCKDLRLIGVSNETIEKVKSLESSGTEQKLQNLTPEEIVKELEENYKLYATSLDTYTAESTYLEWYKKALVYLSKFYSASNSDFAKFKNLDNSGDADQLYSNYKKINGIYHLLMLNAPNQENINEVKHQKTPMVFISHSSKDKEFVEALVELLEGIGLNDQTLFCSSIDGYGIPLGENIFDYLKAQFQEHEIFVVFVHTPNYYQSPVCLNEMGAAWVLQADYCSILSKQMKFEDMKGVVTPNEICVKVDNSDAPARINELKERLTEIFNLPEIKANHWERKRNAFLKLANM